MKVGELINILKNFDDDTDVIIGMVQHYGSNFAMGIYDVEEYSVNPWYGDNYTAVVITEGGQFGTVNYNDDEDENW